MNDAVLEDVNSLVRRFDLRLGTCGYMAKTYVSSIMLEDDTRARRPLAAILYFLVTKETPVVLHRIPADQCYHHYAGGALEVLRLMDGQAFVDRVGGNTSRGELPQLLIPAGTFHAARVVDKHALLGTTSWPEVGREEIEFGERAKLAQYLPDAKSEIERLAVEARELSWLTN